MKVAPFHSHVVNKTNMRICESSYIRNKRRIKRESIVYSEIV
jgi:hypothetical protein